MISSAGPNNDILDSQLSMIEDLDLSMNLIADWETVTSIVSQLPQLKILRLKSMIPWKDIEVLASGLPKLENLQLAGNGIKTLSAIHWESIKCLYLEDNLIDDWTEVEKLQSLPK
ncbi:hypothetical protein RO3G_09796 [Rhizopus delemar RA 99-880]|uniref:U2A'/phosphoprotein 32 family A C-terminal domain-containing protein n=1 Tax=Rhizopus delemar (strain RA 99-880 / ATCC MYA-4621 / FGSC 9543 / NRRL 43880) TaxID=246409 RepID=I1C9F6_RHIO9|nr:hypothetical protein RO3G_09796 [Rhizopus delemar RA 99-880]|eukprot:EIE85086.1 hypothetical protein RO3G_09796 [Rhizopus delemar RA 99-880]